MEKWKHLYDMLQQDIALCLQKHLDKQAEIECCFQISRNYCNKLWRSMEGYAFELAEEEIEFYKIIAPQFNSHVEYYNMIYHAELFRPKADALEAKDFWMRQAERMDKFIKMHVGFYEYYTSGRTDKDEELLIMPSSEEQEHRPMQYSEFIGKFLALHRYSSYIESQH
jgi:hypothetical protein